MLPVSIIIGIAVVLSVTSTVAAVVIGLKIERWRSRRRAQSGGISKHSPRFDHNTAAGSCLAKGCANPADCYLLVTAEVTQAELRQKRRPWRTQGGAKRLWHIIKLDRRSLWCAKPEMSNSMRMASLQSFEAQPTTTSHSTAHLEYSSLKVPPRIHANHIVKTAHGRPQAVRRQSSRSMHDTMTSPPRVPLPPLPHNRRPRSDVPHTEPRTSNSFDLIERMISNDNLAPPVMAVPGSSHLENGLHKTTIHPLLSDKIGDGTDGGHSVAAKAQSNVVLPDDPPTSNLRRPQPGFMRTIERLDRYTSGITSVPKMRHSMCEGTALQDLRSASRSRLEWSSNAPQSRASWSTPSRNQRLSLSEAKSAINAKAKPKPTTYRHVRGHRRQNCVRISVPVLEPRRSKQLAMPQLLEEIAESLHRSAELARSKSRSRMSRSSSLRSRIVRMSVSADPEAQPIIVPENYSHDAPHDNTQEEVVDHAEYAYSHETNNLQTPPKKVALSHSIFSIWEDASFHESPSPPPPVPTMAPERSRPNPANRSTQLVGQQSIVSKLVADMEARENLACYDRGVEVASQWGAKIKSSLGHESRWSGEGSVGDVEEGRRSLSIYGGEEVF